MASVKPKDKYIVSFNSDTSDSEDDSDNDAAPKGKPAPATKKPAAAKPAGATTTTSKQKQQPSEPLMNGHVGTQNGDDLSIKTKLKVTDTRHNKKSSDINNDDLNLAGKLNGPSSSLPTDLTGSARLSSSSAKDKTNKDYLLSSGDLKENGPKNIGVVNKSGELSSIRSGDLLGDSLTSSSKTSRVADLGSSSRGTKGTGEVDLESAYTRAKEKNSLLAKKMDQDKSKPLIDLSDDSSVPLPPRESSTTNYSGRSSDITASKPSYGVSAPSKYSLDLENEMSDYFNKGEQHVANGLKQEPPMDFRDFEIKKNIKEDGNEEFSVGADILIFASPGSNSSKPPPPVFDLDLDTKRDTKPRSFNFEDDLGSDKMYNRQNSKPDELEELLSPKENKYRNLDEKFSAICSKYGRDSKRDGPPKTKLEDDELDSNMDVFGTVKVKTTSKQDPAPKSTYDDDNEDLGFSEERTPRQKLTFDDIVNWKKSPTEDLIQRILADARSEASSPKTSGITRGREPRDEEMFREKRYSSLEPPNRTKTADVTRSYDYGQAEPSLLERRLAALGGQQNRSEDNEPSSYRRSKVLEDDQYGRPKTNYQDDQFYKRKTRGSSVPCHFDDSDTVSLDSASNYRYVPWKERQKALPTSGAGYDDDDDMSCGASARGYQSNLLAPPGKYEGESDSDNESYRSRTPVMPDEWFKPEKSEDTHVVVRERTTEARNMVDNQTEVLGRLKKATNDFNDLDAEIRALKQQCIENQVARQTIVNDILNDMKRDKSVVDEEPAPAPKRYTRGSYLSTYSSSPYQSSYSRSRESSRCRFDNNDYDSERLGGYALGSVAKSRWGEPGGSRSFRSASVSRFDNVEREHSYDKYGLYNARTSFRAGSHVPDDDNKSEYGGDNNIPDDRSDCVSVRSHASDKDDKDETSSYRSSSRLGSSKYGSHLSVGEPSSYSRGYTPSVTRESRSTMRRAPSVCSLDSTPSSYDKRRTRGTSLPPPEKPFTSRFLSKVREKKASGVDISSSSTRDKPFKSRFLNRSFDSDYHSGSSSRGSLASTPDRSTTTRSYSSRKRDTDTNSSETTAAD